ncbi:MAG: hypothetical protein A2484_07605 [Nitrospirae bacterium RIFOXYC2_FULL_44_7]|nr:MAG: hypothetical protein A2484_07605 [Nitrospirae bacterium RIFOXYC2_FULL_44_7]
MTLAIHGGSKVRNKPLPYRRLFGEKELDMVRQVFEDSLETGVDFGFQGKYEQMLAEQFCKFQEGGFADGVSSGTAAVYIALQALEIKSGSDVVVSPVTSPGSIMPVAVSGCNIIIPDSNPDAFNISPEEFEKSLTPNTKAVVLTHLGGQAFDIEPIKEIAELHGIKLIEDCSQAHGAIYKGKRVGCFSDIAAFSTMFSKTIGTGGCGGMVYTNNEDYYWKVRSYADRGKPFNTPNFDNKNSTEYLFPALNFNLDELSSAIGVSVLSRLQKIIDKRLEIARKIDRALDASSVVSPANLSLPESVPSVFFHTVVVDTEKIRVPKKEFAKAVGTEGIWVNGDYRDIVSEWKWIQKYLGRKVETPNAVDFRNRTFNILFNERFSDQEVEDIIECILKVEKYYKK